MRNLVDLRLLIIAASLFGSGCAASAVMLKGPNGEIVRCEPSAAATQLGGYLGSKKSVDDCVQQYETQGYNRVSK